MVNRVGNTDAARQQIACGDHQNAKGAERRGESKAKRNDQEQAELDPMKRDCAQQNDDCGRTRDQPAGHPNGKQAFP